MGTASGFACHQSALRCGLPAVYGRSVMQEAPLPGTRRRELIFSLLMNN